MCRRIALWLFSVLRSFQRVKDHTYLKGIFRPVDSEVFSNELEVEGTVPIELDGLYIRTGPNPEIQPKGGYHWFDGDGMVHAVMFENGRALSYQNHWIRGTRLLYERLRGRELWMRLGDMIGITGLLIIKSFAFVRPYLPPVGAVTSGAGNTALVHHSGRLLALNEGSLPFLLRVCQGLVRSVGHFSWGGKRTRAFTAHPKLDPVTGELCFFVYQLDNMKGPWVWYNWLSPEGDLNEDIPVDVSRPQMMHDFAITEHYAVFIDHALIFDGAAMVKKGGLPFDIEKSQPSRIGLLSRKDPKAPIRWFEVPPFAFIHVANAWETDDGSVHLVLARYESINLTGGAGVGGGDFGQEKCGLVRYEIDLATNTTVMVPLQRLGDRGLDFPVVAPQFVGRPHKLCFGTYLGTKADMPFVGHAKVDMTAPAGTGILASFDFPPGVCGGEAVFVPRDPEALARGDCDEDDGFLVCYVTEAETDRSYCMVYDAKTMSLEPVAKISMPQRVPVGFHGLFVPSKELHKQRL